MTLSPELEQRGLAAVLPNTLVIEVVGADAAKVVHNLCTNDLLKLSPGQCVESFVTDVRGWVVAHVMVLKLTDRIVLLGSHENPTRVVSHIERYIIREDAVTRDLSSQHELVLLDGADASLLVREYCDTDAPRGREVVELQCAGVPAVLCAVPVFSQHTLGMLIASRQREELLSILTDAQFQICTHAEFELRRIANFWPLSPSDIREKTIPQELDRDALTINFTKGCYLGQETIARLDARGQLQKKLCPIHIEAADAGIPGDLLFRGDKEVGHLTSVATDPARHRTLGLAFLRRGNFEPGTTLSCNGQLATVR